jgi:uncharacterized membrane protein YccC
MLTLSTRSKEAIKVALAVTVAMGIALWMDWEKPYWAAFGVIMISLPTEGQSLNKGAMRMLGTLVAILAAFTFLAWFPQQRWLFMAVLSLYIGFCAYMMTGRKRQYFWYASGFICVAIAVNSSNSLTAFQIAVERAQETGTGILVYSLISALLWPQSSRDAFEDASRRLFAVQSQLYRAYRGLMRGEGKPEDSRAQRMQELRLLQQVEVLLNAAETESYEVWEVRHQWRLFHEQSTAVMETLGHWRTGLPEIEPLDLQTLLPDLDALYSELDRRFAQIERMLGGQAPDRMPQAVTLAVDKAAMHALTRFQEAAVVVTKSQLDRLEALSRSVFDCVRDLRGYGESASKPLREEIPRRGIAIDPDRFQSVISVLATLWISFLIWVYVDPPGHASFVYLSVIFIMVVKQIGISPKAILLPFTLATFFAGVPYVFVMPHLSGYGELGLMIFGVTFAIGYLFSEPQQALAKMAGLAMFARFISVQNEQTYSFASYANSAVMVMLVGALLFAMAYIPTNPRPEKVFLRLLSRFFRNAEFLISGLAPDGQRLKGITGRWRAVFYQNDLLELPAKLAAYAQKIDYRAFPANTPEQVQAMVSSLYVLAFRIKDLVEAHGYPQAELVEKHLLDDLRAWHQVIEARLQRRADDPTQVIEPSADVCERLAARLARLEFSIEEIFTQSGKGELSTANYKNLYRLLGSYRGLSEAAISYVQLAEGMKWAQWREARF